MSRKIITTEETGHVLETATPSSDTQTLGIKAFNDLVAADSRMETVILPLRDGLTILRKKEPF